MTSISRPQQFGTIQLVGVASGRGAGETQCDAAPAALRAAGLTAHLRAFGLRVQWTPVIRPTPSALPDARGSVNAVCSQLARRVETIIRQGDMPIVLGGDHTCAIGTWKGVAAAMRSHGRIGLLWIDAHMDAHTPETTESGLLNGMPLACLLGSGHSDLTGIARNARLDPDCVCLFGVRSFEPGEAALLGRLGVRVYLMDEIMRRGVAATFREALAVVSRAQAGFGITLDVDAIDPADAPGVGTPEPNGLRAGELIEALIEQGGARRLLAIEIAEYDPSRDRGGSTAQIIEAVLVAMLLGRTAAGPSLPRMLLERRYGAHNYDSLPVVLARGKGVDVWDDRGRRYIDMMSAYSAVSLGHGHPRIVAALEAQARRLAVTSRAYYNDRLPLFLKRLCEVTGQDLALPVNTGLEAVETALKAVRKWGTKVKRIPEDRVEIIACRDNFHGRSIAILAMSTEAQYREGFGPFPPGFKTIPYGDAGALERAITEYTAGFIVEPIQGEAGIITPPRGYLAECARLCREQNVLLICDEVQTGLGRTGRMFACEHEAVRPDGIILGKALGGGLLPVSAFAARRDVMDVFTPGDHGSTFGGNPLAAAVGVEALAVIMEERLPERAAELGDYLMSQLSTWKSPAIRQVRGKGLLIGVEIDPAIASARTVCEHLLTHGVLSKDTQDTVVRLAPPLVITRAQIDVALDALRASLDDVMAHPGRHVPQCATT